MKKHLLFLVTLLIMGMTLLGQTSITLTFTGRDQHNAHVRLDNVTIQNLTRGWTEAIFFPDTVYTLTVGTGINDYVQGNEMQVMPNPFDGKTQLNIYSVKGELARMVIVDITGKKCAEYQGNLSQGDNYFEISLTTPQTYILSVQTADGTHSVKMVNTGRAGANQISLVGGESNVAKVKISSNRSHVFELGDEMRYTGYSQQSNGLIPSTPVTQQQYESEVIMLNFDLNNDAELPIVATVAASNIGVNTATTGGNVFSDGGATVIARGVCYSVVPNPTLAESHTSDGTGTGAFTSSLTNLVENTTYYIRAYATNSVGTAYGQEVSFTTEVGSSTGQSCPGTPTVTDYDGNIYNTVQIGTQCWMRENLRTTHYANGDPIAEGINYSSVIPYRYAPNGNAATVTTYGYLYNWPAVMHGDSSSNTNPSGRQGICPAGWHVPSAAEWDQLATYVNSHSEFLCGGYNNYIAKALASNIGWNYHNVSNACAVCNDLTQNNATGFSAMPAGQSYGVYHYGFGDMAAFSTSTLEYSDEIKLRGFCYDDPDLTQWLCDADGDLKEGFSVRCVRGEGTSGQLPKVITVNLSDITSNTAVCQGNVISSGTTPVTARGVCYGTTLNPTIADNHTTDGAGAGMFTSNLVGLQSGTIYYFRTYATNSFGTTYGEEGAFVTFNPNDGQPCTNMPTLTDIDGNIYNTVQIGTQCWMKENLRTTHYANGDVCNMASSSSGYYDYNDIAPGRFIPGGSADNVAMYGYLYNLPAVMHGSEGSTSYPSGVRGICPVGWHVPSSAELAMLLTYTSIYNVYHCDSNSNYIAKALAHTTGWEEYSYMNCAVGNNPSSNNATGFSARPAGYRSSSSSSSSYFGSRAYFWSASMYPYYVNGMRGSDFLRISYDAPYCQSSSSNWSDGSYGYSVRCVRDEYDATATAPIVTTDTVITLSDVVASFTGTVISASGATVAERGFCWSTSPNPTIADNHLAQGDGLGSFTIISGNFAAVTTYYVRAYATNSAGVGYGNELIFTMPATDNHGVPCPGAATVTDHEGNVYNTVQIGNQCWMKENMRCTTSPKGTLGNNYQRYFNDTTSIIPLENRGLLYNWCAAMDTTVSGIPYSPIYINSNRGICPEGWHIPSNAEWTTLKNYVNSQNEYKCDNVNNNIAKAMASIYYWEGSDYTCSVGNLPSNNNATGFSAIPAGSFSSSSSTISSSGSVACFWSSTTQLNSSTYSFFNANYFMLTNADAEVYNNNNVALNMSNGCSVRCLRDESVITEPSVTTLSVNYVTQSTAQCGGIVTSDGGSTIEECGICWGTDSNLTVSGNHIATSHAATGTFVVNITGLSPNTTYYVRAYASNIAGMAYGSEVSFTTMNSGTMPDGQPCPEMATVTDIDNNTYNTVQIGTQCWMKENLRTTRYSDGTGIVLGSSTSTTTAYRYYPNNNSANVYTYGYLYNWPAVMHGASSSSVNPSGVQGICPTGWHVPSDAEWTQLTDHVSGQSQYVCGGDSTNIAKSLAYTTGWASSTTTCAVGNNLSANNATGFSAFPAGGYVADYYYFGNCAYFWSSTEDGSYSAWGRSLYSNNANVNRNYSDYKGYCFSVRCLRDSLSAGGDTTVIPIDTAVIDTVVIDSKSCSGTPTVTDHEGNVYATVQIGNQCWMRDNLRTTTSPSTGTYIIPAAGTSYTTTGKQAFWYDNDSAYYAPRKYGLLYNWFAAVDTFYTEYGETSVNNSVSILVTFTGHRQGICPEGWHIPTDEEWNTMEAVVSGSDYENVLYCRGTHAGKLAGSNKWQNSLTTGAPGDYSNTERNISGFSAVPAGYCKGSLFYGVDNAAYFWSTSSYGSNAYNRNLEYDNVGVCRRGRNRYLGYSVRCLRDSLSTGSDTTVTPVDTVVIDSKSCPAAPTVTDHEGNVYATVQIGDQCWMRDNLRTTTSPSTGTYLIPPIGTTYTFTGKQARWYSNDSITYAPMNYGLLYNWNAMMDTFNTAYGETSVNDSSSNAVSVSITGYRRGICPEGWHIPTDAEWNTMEATVCGSDWNTNYENVFSMYRGTHAGKLAGSNRWQTGLTLGAPGDYNNADRNISGFSAVPAGYCVGWSFYYATNHAYFGSYSQLFNYAYVTRELVFNEVGVNRYSHSKHYGFSVRCLRDESVLTEPSVTTLSVNYVTQSTAQCGGIVTSDGGSTIEECGICWGTDSNLTVSGNHIATSHAATGTFVVNITGLSPNTTYYVRAYASNIAGTAYGSAVSFTTPNSGTSLAGQPCSGVAMVTDIDNNIYNTVQIGNQCWMKKNLRTTRYSDGTSIAMGSSASTITAYRYYPNEDSLNVGVHGYLYNWSAVMHEVNSSSANPSGVQGICPTGWHVPSDAEWTQLTDYVSIQSQYVCGDDSTCIGKSFASTIGWNSSTATCAVGNNPSANNATGFSASPAGLYRYSSYDFGTNANFWSSTESSESAADGWGLEYCYAGVYRGGCSKIFAFSVRCVADMTTTVDTIFSEDFSAITDSGSTSIANNLDNYTQMPGWTGDWVFPSIGKVKVGKSTAAGYIQTPALNLSANNGQFVVTFDAKAWTGDNSNLIVFVDGTPYTVSGMSTTSFNTFILPLTGGTSATTIKFQGFQDHRGRFYIDNIRIAQ